MPVRRHSRKKKTETASFNHKPSPEVVSVVSHKKRLLKIISKKTFLYVIGAIFIAFSVYLFWGLPNPTRLTTHPAPASTKILDRHGNLLYEIFVSERRTPISLSSLPAYVWQATLAAEDKDFFQHKGFSLRGISRAFVNTFFRRQLQGGSTITQQLVKKALLTDDRTIRRKAREFILSIAVEALYSKQQILEMYINQIPYGGTAYGLESASETYFSKPAVSLSLSEAALLAALPLAPSYYSPFGSHPEQVQIRQQYVLDQMLDNGFITAGEHASASATPIVYAPPPSIKAPHFSLWVKDLLIEKFGTDMVEYGGLSVTTTLDLPIQEFAQSTVATEVGKLKREKVGNGAALVTRPKTGEIIAMIGSKDYFDTAADGNVNVTLSHRQPGSSIKPLVYATAFEHRLLTPASVIADKPTCFLQPDQKQYCPQNYDNQFHGPTQARFALGNSFNIPAVKTLVVNGLSDFVATASAYGISTWKNASDYGPSLALGGGEVSMLELSTAYGVFSNQGQRVDLNPLLQVQNQFGKVLYEVPSYEISASVSAKLSSTQFYSVGSKNFQITSVSNTRVISPETAFLISHILYDNSARAATFGTSSYLNIKNHPEVSVKTGTTNDKRDNWTIGYNPDLLAAVWVGNNDNTPMSAIASGVTGASPIWNKIMTYALGDLPQSWPVRPADVIGTTVCSLSGLKAPESPAADCSPRYEYFLAGTVPSVEVSNRRDIPIFRPSQTPASTRQLLENPADIEYQNHAVLYDPLNMSLCLDCPGGYGPADSVHLDRAGKAILPR